MTNYYFDTNPLLRWAEYRGGLAEPRHLTIGARVDVILQDNTAVRAISEITIAEFHTHLCAFLRDTNVPQLDRAWFMAVMSEFMDLLNKRRLEVLPVAPRLIECAMAYVQDATLDLLSDVRAWDACHAYQAYEWARTAGTRVVLITGDAGFDRLFHAIPAFSDFVDLLDPSKP